jgi:hypothetical protein
MTSTAPAPARAPERVIVLAAGEGFQLDGFNKLLMRHPATGEPVLEQYLRLFDGLPMTVVVGYRAIEIMHRYPRLDYVYTADWRITHNSYSLALALDERPSYVLSSDFFLEAGVVEALREGPTSSVLAMHRENRTGSALNLELDDDGGLRSVYQGPLRSPRDPDAPGIFKVCSPRLLREWQRQCLENRSRFALLNLPLTGAGDERVYAVDPAPHRLDEVNTPLDYLNLAARVRAEAPPGLGEAGDA